MFPFAGFGESVTVVRRVVSGKDRYNAPEYTEQTVSVPGVMVAPIGDDDEDISPTREKITEALRLHFMQEVPEVKKKDRVIIRGKSYECLGDGFHWRSPYTGEAWGMALTVQRIEG